MRHIDRAFWLQSRPVGMSFFIGKKGCANRLSASTEYRQEPNNSFHRQGLLPHCHLLGRNFRREPLKPS